MENQRGNFYKNRSNLGKTRMDWSGFSQLRDDDTHNIVAAQCRSCGNILVSVSDEKLSTHRGACRFRNEANAEGDLDEGLDFGEIKQIIDKALAAFFFGCNIPFVTVEKPLFLQFLETLVFYARQNPDFSYNPPCRVTLGGSTLSQVNDTIQEEKKKLLKNTNCILQADSWKNSVANTKLLVFSLTNIRTPFVFLTCRDVSSDREFGENIARHFNDAIKYAHDFYEAKVVASVTDNDSKIISGAKLARTVDNEALIVSTCNSHSGNLLVKNIADNIADVVNETVLNNMQTVITLFKQSKIEGLLLRMGGTKVKNYPDTRFCYVRDSIESVLKNLTKMRVISAIEDAGVTDNVSDIVNDLNFEESLYTLYQILTPICMLINECQNPTTNVADATEKWLLLELPMNAYNEMIKARIEKAVWPVGYAANYLHHKYKGSRLNNNQIIIAENFFYNHLDAQTQDELRTFIAERDSYNARAENIDDPIPFWVLLESTYPRLSEFAETILSIPASTAAIEGFFSKWTYCHNKYRNRLGPETSAQLVDTYSFLQTTVPTFRKKTKRTHIP